MPALLPPSLRDLSLVANLEACASLLESIPNDTACKITAAWARRSLDYAKNPPHPPVDDMGVLAILTEVSASEKLNGCADRVRLHGLSLRCLRLTGRTPAALLELLNL